ncbi:serine/threonine-protein kinase [Nonomuraea bangladeshensis]|uniref:serine/threonine-protein kinase n=1 Tax=Nonomuraea bangladeshensis TaxID=404385 RepID=UPI003C2CB52A
MSDATTPALIADRYRLEERIGAGPVGEVWRGYDTRADWVVAVKLLRGAGTPEMLRQHAQAVAKVIHPNVAMVLDVGEHDGAPFLVMEHLTGMSLGEEREAAGGTLGVVETCDLVAQAAAGLDAAHRAGVVHGEIDPDSFRRAGSGVLKVVGFGLGGAATPGGDPRYLAPERAAGDEARPAGDVYALGCVCYELLSGRHPFEAAGTEDAAAGRGAGGGRVPPRTEGAPATDAPATGAAATGVPATGVSGAGPVPPSAFRAGVPAELDRLVLAMIAEDPARRPAGGETIRRALVTIAHPRANPDAPAAPAGMPVTGAMLRGDVPGAAPAARAGDTAVYQAGDLAMEGPRQPARGGRRLVVQLGAAVAAIVAVTIGMVLWANAGGDEPEGRDPVAVATPSDAPTTDVVPGQTPTTTSDWPTGEPSSPPAQPSPGNVITFGPDSELPSALRETPPVRGTLRPGQEPPGGFDRWLSAFDQAVTHQVGTNGINPRVASKAHDKLRKAAGKYAAGHREAALKQVADVYRDLERAQQKGDMEPTGPLAEFIREWAVPGR